MSEIFSKILKDKNGKVLNVGSKYKQPEWGHEVSNGTIEVLPERTYNWPNEKQHFSKVEEDNFSLVSGKVYTVNYNGVSYSCTACHDEIGAGVLIGGEGYPFEIIRYIDILAEMQNAYGQISVFDDSNPFTVSVTLSEEVKVYHKIPGEYVGGVGKYKQPEWGVDTAIVDILPEETHTAAQVEEGMAIFMLPSMNYSLSGDKVYEVNYNGTSYDCPCHVQSGGENGDMYCLGNVGSLGYEGVDMTEEPFVMIFSYVEGVFSGQMIALDGSEMVTLSIKGEFTEIHKIPAEYTEPPIPAPVEPMIVTCAVESSDTYITTRTFKEIKNALESGRNVYVQFGIDKCLSITSFSSDEILFGDFYVISDGRVVCGIGSIRERENGTTYATYNVKHLNAT